MRATRIFVLALCEGALPIATNTGQARPPKDATGQCADGTYTTAKTKENGCTKHGGVKIWFADAGDAPAATPAAAAAPRAAPSVPGQVWVNTATKVYHCPGTKYYGATKEGKYMSEADAKAAGYRPDHGKACS